MLSLVLELKYIGFSKNGVFFSIGPIFSGKKQHILLFLFLGLLLSHISIRLIYILYNQHMIFSRKGTVTIYSFFHLFQDFFG